VDGNGKRRDRAIQPLGIRRHRFSWFGRTFVHSDRVGSNADLPAEERVFNEVIVDYNKSGNPGRFMLTKDAPGRYSVVGISAKDKDGNENVVTPILDTPVAISTRERTVADAVQSILKAVSDKSGQKIELGSGPVNMLFQSTIRLSSNEKPARALLAEAASATRFPLVWRLLYDADAHCYFLNLEPTEQVQIDAEGRTSLQPTRKP
jgi:hypothetical protein